MKNIRGGYANLDLKSLDLKTEHTVAGVFDEVKTYVEDVNKPLIIHNMVYNDELQNDTYVTDVKVSANNIKLYCSGLEITVTNANKIKAIEVEAGGGSADIAKLTMPITIEQLEDLDLSNPVMVIDEEYPDEPDGLGYVNKRTGENVDYYTVSIIYVNHIRTYYIDSSENVLTYEDWQDFQIVYMPITYEKLSELATDKPVKVMSINGQLFGYAILNSFVSVDEPPVTTYELRILTGETVNFYTANSVTQTVTSTVERYNDAIKVNGNVVAHASLATADDYVMAVKDILEPTSTQFALSDFSPALNYYLFDVQNSHYRRIYLPVELHDEKLGSAYVDTQLVELNIHNCAVGTNTSFEATGIMTTTFNSAPHTYLVKLISDSLPGSYVNVYVYRIN